MSDTLNPSHSSAVVFRSLSDPLPTPALNELHPQQSATSLQTFDDAASRAVFKYPRFSTATTLSDTGGPGFSIEELTSTEVSEDEDAIINEPALRRRQLSRLSLQPPSLNPIPTTPASTPQTDRLHQAADYIKDLVTTLVYAIINYVRAAHDHENKSEESRNGQQPCSAEQVVRRTSFSG